MSDLNTTIPKGSLVLVTGANGFVASHTIKQLLERGYRVRGTVRDLEKSSWLTKGIFEGYASRGDLELVKIGSLETNPSFDDAMKGVSSVIHVSTVGFDPNPNNVIPGVISSLTSLMDSAVKAGTVKSFVFTSSITATVIASPDNTTHIGPDTYNETAIQLAWAPPPYEPSRAFFVYNANKAESEKAFWKYVAEKKPPFTANTILPGAILGEFLNKAHGAATYAWVKTIYDGNTDALQSTSATINNNVKDTALLHVAAALDPEVNNQRIHAWGGYCNWNDILAILRRRYPNKKFIDDLPGQTKLQITVDEEPSLKLLEKWGGQKGWTSLEDTVVDNMNSIERLFS